MNEVGGYGLGDTEMDYWQPDETAFWGQDTVSKTVIIGFYSSALMMMFIYSAVNFFRKGGVIRFFLGMACVGLALLALAVTAALLIVQRVELLRMRLEGTSDTE